MMNSDPACFLFIVHHSTFPSAILAFASRRRNAPDKVVRSPSPKERLTLFLLLTTDHGLLTRFGFFRFFLDRSTGQVVT